MGGAITYVAEHVPDDSRGYYTGWLQTSPTLGIVVSLAVIIATRTYFGNQVFDEWAWRVPFLVSFLLVAIAIYIRLQLQETPIFQEIKASGQMTRNPWKEAFLSSNIKYILIACVVLIGQGSGLVQRSVLGVVLSAAGFQGGRADRGLHRGSCIAHCNAELDLFWLAVRPDRPQTGDLGRHVARRDHVLSTVFVAGNGYAARQHQLSDRDLHHFHPRLLRRDGCMGRSGRFWRNTSPAGFGTRRCRCRITSATAGGGGLVPFITSSVFAATGSIGYALIYPIAVPAVCFVLALFLMPETRKISIWEPIEPRTA